jgi:hypothetical protein
MRFTIATAGYISVMDQELQLRPPAQVSLTTQCHVVAVWFHATWKSREIIGLQ